MNAEPPANRGRGRSGRPQAGSPPGRTDPADGAAAAGIPPAESAAAAGIPPADGAAAAGNSPAKRAGAAGTLPAELAAAAGTPPAAPVAFPGDRLVLGIGSAPGKVILVGEHAVVYGRPALAVPVTAVAADATVTAHGEPLAIRSWPLGPSAPSTVCDASDPAADDAASVAVRAALSACGVSEPPPWLVDLRSTIPIGAGMGSSAAVAVALVRAVADAVGTVLSDEEVSALAFEAEKRTHGTPSGIDNEVVARARPIRFLAGTATPLAVGIRLPLVIGDTGVAGPTREMVAAVRRRRQDRPEDTERILSRIGRLAGAAETAMVSGDPLALGRAMDLAHECLRELGVSTGPLDRLVAAARGAGALGAKLAGAGGGGVVVALVEPDRGPAVAAALRAAGAVRTILTAVSRERT